MARVFISFIFFASQVSVVVQEDTFVASQKIGIELTVNLVTTRLLFQKVITFSFAANFFQFYLLLAEVLARNYISFQTK